MRSDCVVWPIQASQFQQISSHNCLTKQETATKTEPSVTITKLTISL